MSSDNSSSSFSIESFAPSHQHSTATAPSNFAFLVHSQNTLRDTLPPNVDNESVARQKRRRTSPGDQAILEAEFEKDDRPDRAARKAISQRVRGMGEKEVQIWFQNRRQNIRRRSRPLLPHEMAQLRPPGLHGSDRSTYGIEARSSQSLRQPNFEPKGDDMDNGGLDSPEETKDARSEGFAPFSSQAQKTHFSSQGAPSSDPVDVTNSGRRSLKRSLSGKRLSMTSEGAARLLADDESSPSPPRPRSTLNFELDLFSPANSTEDVRATQKESNMPSSTRSASGRSRDSRAWEFWCDSDARNELVKKAEQQQSGSAAAAISLIRSSSRKVLTANSVNANLSPKLSKDTDKVHKPSLTRSRTSMARMQTDEASSFHLHEDIAAEDNSTPLSRFRTSPSGDSDKENRDPHLQQSAQRRKLFDDKPPSASQQRTALLRTSHTAPNAIRGLVSDNYGNGRQSNKRRKPLQGTSHENFNPEADDEIARFMNGGKSRSSLSLADEQDMDVVQGLLSLSKG